jgi:hypothetical protein
VTTVGAATTDRVFPATLRLGNGVVLTDQSLYALKSKGTSMVQLVYSSCDEDDLTLDKVMGKLVVCTWLAGAETGFYVQRAGGAGMVSPDRMTRTPGSGTPSWPRPSRSPVSLSAKLPKGS